jgi:hypothetical protein
MDRVQADDVVENRAVDDKATLQVVRAGLKVII